MKEKNLLGLLQRGVLFRIVVRFHILPKVSCRNDQSSIKFKSKLIVSFANGSGTYKLLECKGDSSVACTFNRFIFSLFRCCFWLPVTNSTKYIAEKKQEMSTKSSA